MGNKALKMDKDNIAYITQLEVTKVIISWRMGFFIFVSGTIALVVFRIKPCHSALSRFKRKEIFSTHKWRTEQGITQIEDKSVVRKALFLDILSPYKSIF